MVACPHDSWLRSYFFFEVAVVSRYLTTRFFNHRNFWEEASRCAFPQNLWRIYIYIHTSIIFLKPILGETNQFDRYFQLGWNHELVVVCVYIYICIQQLQIWYWTRRNLRYSNVKVFLASRSIVLTVDLKKAHASWECKRDTRWGKPIDWPCYPRLSLAEQGCVFFQFPIMLWGLGPHCFFRCPDIWSKSLFFFEGGELFC